MDSPVTRAPGTQFIFSVLNICLPDSYTSWPSITTKEIHLAQEAVLFTASFFLCVNYGQATTRTKQIITVPPSSER